MSVLLKLLIDFSWISHQGNNINYINSHASGFLKIVIGFYRILEMKLEMDEIKQ